MSANAYDDKSLLDRLYDENDSDPIILNDENGKKVSFEQLAIIPYGDEHYCILAPTNSNDFEDIADDEAIVFRICDEEGEEYVTPENDETIAEAVFNEFLKLLDEE